MGLKLLRALLSLATRFGKPFGIIFDVGHDPDVRYLMIDLLAYAGSFPTGYTMDTFTSRFDGQVRFHKVVPALAYNAGLVLLNITPP